MLQQNKDYTQWLGELKSRIRGAQIKAAIAVNAELLMLYWDLGREIAEKEKAASYGSKLIPQLSNDLLKAFPEMKGFSRRNLFYVKQWYQFYGQGAQSQIVQQLVAQSSESSQELTRKLSQTAKQSGQQAVAQIPAAFLQVPWGHHLQIISKCKEPEEALFYINETIRNNWSRNILVLQIESGLYNRQGKAITNFEATLPKPQSDLARDLLKSPYNFDFLTLGKEAQERDIENALIAHITNFLLELGQGFAYLGRQYKLRLEEDEYFLDLLFYHTRLRCYVVIELKADEFKPEYAGKLNFYLNLVDDLVRTEDDKPSIGMLLCREAGRLRVEYALRNIARPIGVSEYQLTEALPENLKGSLPTIEEIEAELNPDINQD